MPAAASTEAPAPSVAVVGGGAAGLACAARLAEHGFDVRLFTTGRRGCGGLLATRSIDVPQGHPTLCDTAVQLFSASHPRFLALCERWEALGWVRRWAGRAVRLRLGGAVQDLPDASASHIFAAVGGMECLAGHLAEELRRQGAAVRTQMWASALERTPDGRWDVKWDLWSMGVADYAVVAHSGKCARRITAGAGLRKCHEASSLVRLGVVWCVAAVFTEPLGLPFEVAIIDGSEELAWASNQSAKLGQSAGTECWSIFSTNKYGWRHKVPQEFVPPETLQSVSEEILGAFQRVTAPLRDAKALPQVVQKHTQLWGAGLSGSVLENADHVFDPFTRAGVCADWCVAPCVEGAVLSGLGLADTMAAHRAAGPAGARQEHPPGEPSMRSFRPACEIAAFPGWLDPPTRLCAGLAATTRGPAVARGAAGHPADSSCAEAEPPSDEGLVQGNEASAGAGASKRWSRRQSGRCGPAACPPHPEARQGCSDSGVKTRRWRAAEERVAPPDGGRLQEESAGAPEKPMAFEMVRAPPCSSLGATREELQPGLVLLRGVVSEKAQRWAADEVLKLGGCAQEPRTGAPRSGGFYRLSPGGRLELNGGREKRGSFVRRLSECDSALLELCQQCFAEAAKLSGALPPLEAQACAFNFYAEDSPGIRWHRDIDETGENLREKQGRPVVSVSLGDECDFQWRPRRFEDEPRTVRLRSGDVLVFGGPSRGIPHAVTRIYPDTAPGHLRMPPGRINLTYRHHS